MIVGNKLKLKVQYSCEVLLDVMESCERPRVLKEVMESCEVVVL